MKPLNQAERKKAFGNFLLFFIITMAVILTAVFFSMQVPFAENRKMKNQIGVYQKEQAFAVQFSAQMTDPQILLTRLASSRSDSVEYLKGLINNKISQLFSLKSTDSAANGDDNIYAKSLNSLYLLQNAYSNLANYMVKSQNQDELSQENQSLKQRLSDANNYIVQLSTKVGMPAPPPY